MLENLGIEDFRRVRNTKFRLYDDASNHVDIELVEVVDEQVNPTEKGERFSLFFHVPVQSMIPQRIYEMEHEQLGKLQMFIVPVSAEENGFRYQAVFNRLKRETRPTATDAP